MGFQDLFTNGANLIGQMFGGSVVRIAPDKSRTTLQNVVFHDLTDQEMRNTPDSTSTDKYGVLDNVPIAQAITVKDVYEINGESWKYRGDGGSDGAYKSVLILLPGPQNHTRAGRH